MGCEGNTSRNAKASVTIFGLKVLGPERTALTKSPPKFKAKSFSNLRKTSNTEAALIIGEANLPPTDPMLFLMGTLVALEESSNYLLEVVQSVLGGDHDLEKVEGDGREGAFDQSEATPEGEVTMGPPRNRTKNFLLNGLKEVFSHIFPIQGHTKVGYRKITTLVAGLIVDNVAPEVDVASTEEKIAFMIIDGLPSSGRIVIQKIDEVRQPLTTRPREDDHIVSISEMRKRRGSAARFVSHRPVISKESIQAT